MRLALLELPESQITEKSQGIPSVPQEDPRPLSVGCTTCGWHIRQRGSAACRAHERVDGSLNILHSCVVGCKAAVQPSHAEHQALLEVGYLDNARITYMNCTPQIMLNLQQTMLTEPRNLLRWTYLEAHGSSHNTLTCLKYTVVQDSGDLGCRHLVPRPEAF